MKHIVFILIFFIMSIVYAEIPDRYASIHKGDIIISVECPTKILKNGYLRDALPQSIRDYRESDNIVYSNDRNTCIVTMIVRPKYSGDKSTLSIEAYLLTEYNIKGILREIARHPEVTLITLTNLNTVRSYYVNFNRYKEALEDAISKGTLK